jgi:DNA polymerase-3 subunit epsilon
LKIHGLTNEFLADKPLFAAVADELVEFVDDAEIVIHNAPFDVGFMDAEFARLGRPAFASIVAKVTDTLSLAREMYPGKSNSLDALCRRLEVDNSNRTLHGALLDAGLLAEVYIRMTRGQDSLVIDLSDAGGAIALDGTALDLSTFELIVVAPSTEELAAHAALLADLDKASGGRTLWRVAVA